MKKILAFFCFIIGLYIISVFAFPSIANTIGAKIGLLDFNQSLIHTRDSINSFITGYDVNEKIIETKNQALEIKQNVETQVQETKQKIETIQTNVEKTTQAIDETTKAVNNTLNSLNELGNSIGDIVPSSNSGDTNSGTTN